MSSNTQTSSLPTHTNSQSAPQQRVLFNANTLRNLGDKSYERRKTAAIEIESIARQLSTQPGSGQYINSIISTLVTDYTFSTQPNSRKGGLIGLSSIAIALLHHATPYLELLLPPVLRCFVDQDSRVRYYACEALYNIVKICRSDILLYFNELFDGLCKLTADQDPDVRSACMLLDRLLKDIVSSCEAFNTGHFLPLLRERIRLKHPNVRLLIINWIAMLNSLFDVAMTEFLPDLLGGLFSMLSDPHKDIKYQTMSLLHAFLQQITTSPKITMSTGPNPTGNSTTGSHPVILHNIEYSTMIFPIVQHATTNESTTRSVIVIWLHNFILLARSSILPFLPHIIGALFCCIHDDTVDSGEVRSNALHTNDLLLHIVRELIQTPEITSSTQLVPSSHPIQPATELIDYPTLLSHFINQLSSPLLHARVVSIQWLTLLLIKYPQDLTLYIDTILPPLLLILQTESDSQVFSLIIECLARIILLPPPTEHSRSTALVESPPENAEKSNDSEVEKVPKKTQINPLYFQLICINLLSLFATDLKFLELRAQRILCTLSTFIPAHTIFTLFSSLLRSNLDIEFTKIMVETMHLILFTTEEFAGLRQIIMESTLTTGDTVPSEKQAKCIAIFLDLFSAFVHSPIPAISLCLLSQNYMLSSGIIAYLTNAPRFQPSIGFLLQLEQFVQLFESSIFSHCRCHLLMNGDAGDVSGSTSIMSKMNKNAFLHSLCALLTLLPQSHCFFMLKNRLEASTMLITKQDYTNTENSLNSLNNSENHGVLHQLQQYAISRAALTNNSTASLSVPASENTTTVLNNSAILQALSPQSKSSGTNSLSDTLLPLLQYYISIQQRHDDIKNNQQRASLLVSDDI